MSIPIDGEELMDISVLSEEGLVETSEKSTDYLTYHRNYDVSEPTEDFVGGNDIVEEVVTATSDHEGGMCIPPSPGKRILDLQTRLNDSLDLNKDIVKEVAALTAFKNSCKCRNKQ